MPSHIEVTVTNHKAIHKEMLPTLNMHIIDTTWCGKPITELLILGQHYTVAEPYEEIKARLMEF